ncbi:hypothetical protein NMG60_11017243 [Bertholletia excelsa]
MTLVYLPLFVLTYLHQPLINLPPKLLSLEQMNPKTCTKRKPKSHPSKSNQNPSSFPIETTIIWSNWAFISNEFNDNGCGDDECSSVGSNANLSAQRNIQELKLSEKLGTKIEKELEREIMEGILVLVQRLSDLKAKQICKGLEEMHLGQFLGEFYGSNGCTLC